MNRLFRSVARNLTRCISSETKFVDPVDLLKFDILRYKGEEMSSEKSRRVLHVIGCHENASKALVLTANHVQYFFNCSHGMQRMLHSMELPRAKDVNMLITQNVWSNIGGLIGFCCHFKGFVKIPVRCHGAPALKQILSNARGFSQFDEQPIVILRTKKVYTDDFLKITYVPLTADAPEKDDRRMRKRNASLYNNEVTSYIIEALPLAKRIDMEKCVQLGIKQGPMVGLLKKGQLVTLPDGTVIKPEQVLKEEEPVEPPLFVVDCPSISYLESLNSGEHLQAFYGEEKSKLSLVVHLTPADVMLDAAYIQWMKRFGSEVRHLVVNDMGQSSPFPDALWLQSQMNLIDSKIFPLLHNPFTKTEEEVEMNREMLTKHGLDVTLGRSFLQYCWSTKQDFDLEKVVTSLDVAAEQEKALNNKAFQEMRQEFLPKATAMRDNTGSEFPQFTFLGTASSAPSKYRNISGILLQARQDQYFILDCGESSLTQMILHYGLEKVNDILVNLDMIYISHLHPDHHLGFFTILLARQKAFADKGLPYKLLEVVTCQAFENWYRLVETYFGIPVSQLIRHTWVENFQVNFFNRLNHSLLEDISMAQIRSVHVHHTQYPFGVCLKHLDGWSVVYSGDTMPCNALVEEGQGCDVLIHEATFMEGMEVDAEQKNHSTLPQALKIGKDMKAKFTLLTHFSQRFHMIPIMPPDGTHDAGSATDHMRISMKELRLLPLFKPLLQELFKKEHNEVLRRMGTWRKTNAERKHSPRKKYKVKQHKRDLNYPNFSPPEDLSPNSPLLPKRTKLVKGADS